MSGRIIYRPSPPAPKPRPHECRTDHLNASIVPVGSIYKCHCYRYWFRKQMRLTQAPIITWNQVRWYHFGLWRIIREWDSER